MLHGGIFQLETDLSSITVYRLCQQKRQCSSVQRMRVKIALNVVKASKLVQLKLITYRSKLGLGAFRKFSAFVLTPIWLPQIKAFH